MSSRFGNMSEELFQILKGTGKILTLFDAQGRKVYEPRLARKFFAEPDKMMISVNEDDNDSSINLYLSQTADLNSVSGLINTLRSMSSRYNVILDVKKYGKELSPKDFAYQTIGEASMWGSTKTSYQKIGSAKLVVRHCAPVREDVMGSRARNILSLFVETKGGERLKFPVCHLSGARAWAKHLSEGGLPHDEMGSYIVELAQEASDLTKVTRYVQHSRKTLAEEAQGVRTQLRHRVLEIRKELQAIGRSRGYTIALETKAYENKSTINEDRHDAVELECQRLRELLDIDTNHALAETIRPVALITLGENIMTIDTTKFSQVLALESVDDLIETLTNEYGLLENNHWVRHEYGLAVLPESIDDVKGYLDLSESAYDVLSEGGDPWINFASDWFSTRKADSGQEGEGPDDRDDRKSAAKVEDLANGLRDIANGRPIADVDLPDEMPGFADQRSEVRFKLGLFLDADAGMQNDSLWTWISNMVDKLQDDKPLSPVERIMAGKLVSSLDDMNESHQGADDILEYGDPTSYEAGATADAEENAEAEVFHSFEKYYLGDFLAKNYPFFEGPCDQEEAMSTSEVQGDLQSYLGKLVADELGRDYYDVDDEMARDLMPKVIKIAQKNGWTFDSPINEADVSALEIGDTVATDFGPAEIVEVGRTQVKVILQHGASKVLDITDVDKVDREPTRAVKELADMEAWFEQFDPQKILAPQTEIMEEEPAEEAAEEITEQAAVPSHFEGGAMAMNDAESFVAYITANHGPTLANVASDVIEGDHYHEMSQNALKFIADVASHQGESSLARSLQDYLSLDETSKAGDMGDDFIADVKKDDLEDTDNELVGDLAFLRKPQNEALNESTDSNQQLVGELSRLRLLAGLKK